MNWGRAFFIGFLIFAAFFLVTDPVGAAGAVNGAWDALADVAGSLITFFDAL